MAMQELQSHTVHKVWAQTLLDLPTPDLSSAAPPKISPCFLLFRPEFRSCFPSLGGLLVELWPRLKPMALPKCAFGLPGIILCEPRRPRVWVLDLIMAYIITESIYCIQKIIMWHKPKPTKTEPKTRTGHCIRPNNNITKTETNGNQNRNQVSLHWPLQSIITGCGFGFGSIVKKQFDNALAVLESHLTHHCFLGSFLQSWCRLSSRNHLNTSGNDLGRFLVADCHA